MNLNPDILYEILSRTDYQTFLRTCSQNRAVLKMCRTNAQLQRLFRQKLTDDYLQRNKDDPGRALVDASAKGKLVVVDELLARGADPSFADNAALIQAIRGRRIGIIKRLLRDERVDPNGKPLELAARLGSPTVLRELLKRADPSSGGSQALLAAVGNEKITATKILLEDPRTDPNAQNYRALGTFNRYYRELIFNHPRFDPTLSAQPLIIAILVSDRDLLKRLLARTDPSIEKNKALAFAIFEAVRSPEHLEDLQILLSEPRVDPTEALITQHFIELFHTLPIQLPAGGVLEVLMNAFAGIPQPHIVNPNRARAVSILILLIRDPRTRLVELDRGLSARLFQLFLGIVSTIPGVDITPILRESIHTRGYQQLLNLLRAEVSLGKELSSRIISKILQVAPDLLGKLSPAERLRALFLVAGQPSVFKQIFELFDPYEVVSAAIRAKDFQVLGLTLPRVDLTEIMLWSIREGDFDVFSWLTAQSVATPVDFPRILAAAMASQDDRIIWLVLSDSRALPYIENGSVFNEPTAVGSVRRILASRSLQFPREVQQRLTEAVRSFR